ncbi:CRISPR-associated helicase Cas3' [Paenibacillus sp. 481]|uniref:CRISPR-associated helicase Cas3' n=1 Tax=Paenibacillus sp. 481 TaxID=2835869 RepID=UPI001E5D1985|nr:CRISPR-associated helicase Cas3' [Paenibacillus sp. 481]UHA72662.1 CRISPR-associated helicase Cas3' [Paenibacillus sp. 481]
MFVAKTKPVEQSIAEHTSMLLRELEILRSAYGKRLKEADASFWRLLVIAILFHDTGKAYTPFQNKVNRALGKLLIKTFLADYPHNYLSVALVPFDYLNLDMEEQFLLIDAIGFHHEGRSQMPEENVILHAYKQDMYKKIPQIFNHLSQIPVDLLNELDINIFMKEHDPSPYISDLQRNRCSKKSERKLRQDERLWRRHVLLKGLLHRIDHAASAGVRVEEGEDESPGEVALSYLNNQYKVLRPVQLFALENRNKNIICASSVGTGKTEAALLWIGTDKSFFTLPLRVSLNAMFTRFQREGEINLQSVGLLHSTSYEKIEEAEYTDHDLTYESSRQFAKKLTLSTIDQILKFPYYYCGFEKELATMAYSKVVIDEIQAYDPKIAAMLIFALDMIYRIGGQFMVMTATLPALYVEAIEKHTSIPVEEIAFGTFTHDVIRHRIGIRGTSIFNDVEEIFAEAASKKVLVIVNTVDQAIKFWEFLVDRAHINGESCSIPKLLHARFTQEDRNELEKEILGFAQSGWHLKEEAPDHGIWITTQIVEASLDIDFDLLYTEICSLDSLFQRMGRCYRVRLYDENKPNVIVFTEECSGISRSGKGGVYDRDVVKIGLEMLNDLDGKCVDEQAKMCLVEKLYSRTVLKGTAYLTEFDNAIDVFKNMEYFKFSKIDAQKMMREIETQMVIPAELWPKVSELVEEYQFAKDKETRRSIRREIEKKTVSVRMYWLSRNGGKGTNLTEKGLEHIQVLSMGQATYSKDEATGYGPGLKPGGETAFFD